MAYLPQHSLSWGPFRGQLNANRIVRSCSLFDFSLEVVDPTISTATIIGTTCAILVVLFVVQPFGTSRLGSTFAPVVIIWLLFNLTFGIYVSEVRMSLESS